MRRSNAAAEALGLTRETVAVSTAMFVMGLGENLWRRFLPKYLESFGAPITAIGLFGTAEDFLDGIYQYPGGWVADRYGRRRALRLFVSLSAAGYLLFALMAAWPIAFAALALIMAWDAMASPTLFAVVGDALPREKRTMGFTVQSMPTHIGHEWRAFPRPLRWLLASDVFIRTCEGMVDARNSGLHPYRGRSPCWIGDTWRRDSLGRSLLSMHGVRVPLAPRVQRLQLSGSSEDLMRLERLPTPSCAAPFPIHRDLVARMLAAHAPDDAHSADRRDTTVAHVLATCAGYSYSGTATVATMMARLGLTDGACVRIAQVVSAMRIASTAYLVQSRCGRVVILCYRGTQGDNIDSWLGDVDVDPETITLGGNPAHVHSGFYRNVRVTRSDVLEELAHALAGRSLVDPSRRVEHPLEALYVTGHSLGGAMAVLFALSVVDTAEERAVAKRMRAIYTYGQPIATMDPLGDVARQVGRTLFRHVLVRDIVPALPPAKWGPFVHIGHEYRWLDGSWQKSDDPVAPLENVRELPRAFSLLVAPAKQRKSAHYTVREHGPHHYIAALRPKDRVTEYGDRV